MILVIGIVGLIISSLVLGATLDYDDDGVSIVAFAFFAVSLITMGVGLEKQREVWYNQGAIDHASGMVLVKPKTPEKEMEVIPND